VSSDPAGADLQSNPHRNALRRRRVAAVIVTYRRALADLTALLQATVAQVETVVVIDNTPAPSVLLDDPRIQCCDVVINGRNVGLAAAQNQGIALARKHQCDHVLLLDDDSLPAVDMVERLTAALDRLDARGERVAAVGPRWHDRHTGRDAPFVRLGIGRMHNIDCTGRTGDTIECDTLVSSGCLVPLARLDEIGAMDERLFIDQVDVEWGLRAQAQGFRLYGVCDAVLYHGIGERTVRPWFARGRNVPVHAPLRDYYLVRNIVAVFFLRPAPWRWRLVQLLRLPGLVLVIATQMPPRARRLRLIARGLADALLGRLGPAPAIER